MPRDDEACFKNKEKNCCVELKRNDNTYNNEISTNLVLQEIIKGPTTAAYIQSDSKEDFKVSATYDFSQASTDDYFDRDCKYNDNLKPKTDDYLQLTSCDYLEPMPTDYLKPECKYFLETIHVDFSSNRPDDYLQTINEKVHSKLYNYTQFEINYHLKQQNINDNLIQPQIDEDHYQLHGRSENNVYSKSDPAENYQVMCNENIDDYCALFPSNKIGDMSLTVI